jgi:hypothetical protein
VPSGEHRQHAGGIGADGEEAGLRQADLAGEEHDVSREPEERVHPDQLREAEVEVQR